MPKYSWSFRPALFAVLVSTLLFSACQHATPIATPAAHMQRTSTLPGTVQTQHALSLPRPTHVVVVMEENDGYAQIIGSASAPYINALATQGALFTHSHAITHPSQPNYLALFSASTQSVTDDSCPQTFAGQNLASELLSAGASFGGYSESMPSIGYTGCSTSLFDLFGYARKHNPWSDFPNLSSRVNLPWTSFPTNFSTLPTVSFVVPNQQNDMHSGSIRQADTWLQTNLNAYVQWEQKNNSLLIVTWDEDDGSSANHIPTLFVGPMVKVGQYSETIDHYSVLRTLEAFYGLPYLGEATNRTTISDVWN